MKHSRFRSAITLLLMLPAAGARAGDIHVAPPPVGAAGNPGTRDSPLSLVQLAIYQASDGDTVWVAPGTYNESVSIQGRNIVLRSHDPLDPAVVAQTVIDGTGRTNPGIIFDGSESPACTVSGFTICNFGVSAHGGAIRGGTDADHTRATISHNVIEDNHATLYGGGICYCDGDIVANTIRGNDSYDGGGLSFCDGEISGNLIRENTAEYAGAGLFGCGGTITGNIIKYNAFLSDGGQETGGRGGACDSCAALIEGNDISGNRADYGGGLSFCSGIVLRNRIYNNWAYINGGGLSGCNGMVLSNLVVGNHAVDYGGGMNGCDGTVCNNTVEDNSAGISGEALFGCDGILVNNIIWHNTGAPGPQLDECSTPSYCCVGGWSGGGVGNIATAPGFVDPDGPDNIPGSMDDNDYRLLADSPCIDSGLNDPLAPPRCDLDGRLRIARVSAPSPVVDMGAYESGSRRLRIAEFGFTDFPSPGRFFILDSQPNDTYVLWSSYGLSPPNWTRVRTLASGGETTLITDHTLVPLGVKTRFYKVTME